MSVPARQSGGGILPGSSSVPCCRVSQTFCSPGSFAMRGGGAGVPTITAVGVGRLRSSCALLQPLMRIPSPSTSDALQLESPSNVSPAPMPCTMRSMVATTPVPSGPGGTGPSLVQPKSTEPSSSTFWRQDALRPVLLKNGATLKSPNLKKFVSVVIVNSNAPRFVTPSTTISTVKTAPGAASEPLSFVEAGSTRMTGGCRVHRPCVCHDDDYYEPDEQAGDAESSPPMKVSVKSRTHRISPVSTGGVALSRWQVGRRRDDVRNRPANTPSIDDERNLSSQERWRCGLLGPAVAASSGQRRAAVLSSVRAGVAQW